METRARSLLVGAFTLAVIAAGFVFVYWLNTAGGLGERAHYRIRYQNSVSGLLVGSAVLFNGVRVGEVTALDLDPSNPREITATIGVDPGTPVSEDTKAGIDFPGLMGSPAVSLTGGASTTRLAAQAGAVRGEYPLIVADPNSGQSISEAARATLRRLDAVVAENAEPLHNTIANLSKFSDALGRNSDKVDGIVSGIERLTGGGSKAAGTLYDLTPLRNFPQLEKSETADLAIAEPTVTFALSQDKIFLRSGGGLTPIADARWGDMLANMFQIRVIQTFENAHVLREVSKGGDNQAAFELAIDVRSFEVESGSQAAAVVGFTAKISSGEGRVIASKEFRQSVPVADVTAASAAGALDKAFGAVMSELVVWTSAAIKGAS